MTVLQLLASAQFERDAWLVKQRKTTMSRCLVLSCTLGAWIGVVASQVGPLHSKLLNAAFLGCLAAGWCGLLALAWPRKGWCRALLIAPILLAIPFLLPGREIDAAELREDYVRRLGKLEGTKYYWGGEGAGGIDCSGLPRRAYRDALFVHGIKRLNGRALRVYLEQWWHDASARALSEGYRAYTRSLALKGAIREMDYGDLLPGDLAVTTSGLHVLVYMGQDRWIQADPGSDGVVLLNGRKDDNGWFRTSVTAHRWTLLDSAAPIQTSR